MSQYFILATQTNREVQENPDWQVYLGETELPQEMWGYSIVQDTLDTKRHEYETFCFFQYSNNDLSLKFNFKTYPYK